MATQKHKVAHSIQNKYRFQIILSNLILERRSKLTFMESQIGMEMEQAYCYKSGAIQDTQTLVQNVRYSLHNST